ISCQEFCLNLRIIPPEVGTFSINLFPNLLTKSVMALLCPKTTKFWISFLQFAISSYNSFQSKVYSPFRTITKSLGIDNVSVKILAVSNVRLAELHQIKKRLGNTFDKFSKTKCELVTPLWFKGLS